MDYKVLFIDIDGTLVAPMQKVVSPAVQETLEKLKEKGIPVVITTGRSYTAVPDRLFNGFKPDYYICVNGAVVQDAAGTILYEETLEEHHLKKIVEFFESQPGSSLGFSFRDGYYTYVNDAIYREFYFAYSTEVEHFYNGEEQTRHLENMPHLAWGLLPRDKADDLKALHDDLAVTHFQTNGVDVAKAGVNKMTGAEVLLKKLGHSWEEVVFIGDGDNDKELLKKAGLGVAMGNADADVQAIADVVTGTVEQDGVAKAIEKYFL